MVLINRSFSSTRRILAACRRACSTNSSHTGDGGDGGVCGAADAAGAAGAARRRVVSGLQPTGALHVGNYFGALRRCVRAQDSGHELMLFIADLHALTTHHEPAALQEHTLQLAALALGAGVDPERAVLWQQSAVPRHAELCWLLACLCTQARVAHLPQYRERSARGDAALGALLYPVLQAADVLLLRATHVPVGADQRQHLQLAAQLARTFHHRYGPLFPIPVADLPDDGSDRIRSLRDPSRKMSKSDRDTRATIYLTDSDDAIRDKIRKAVTDCAPHVSYEPETRPGVANLVALHCLATDQLPEEVVEESHALTTAQYKGVVAEALCAALGGVRARAARWGARPRDLRHVLRAGAARARAEADATYQQVAERLGLTAPRPHPSLLRPPAEPTPLPDVRKSSHQ